MVKSPTVDQLAQAIRMVDGSNTLGAGDLDETILAALEPAPDQSDWNAAIEAAAETFDRLRGPWMGQNAAAAIRALKKGPPQ